MVDLWILWDLNSRSFKFAVVSESQENSESTETFSESCKDSESQVVLNGSKWFLKRSF